MIFTIFDNVNNELYFIYGLVALVVVLIMVIIVIDKLDNKKTKKSLSDTLSLKPIEDPANFKNVKPEIISVNQVKEDKDFKELVPIPEVKLDNPQFEDYNSDDYVETDLDKTQAQIRVEEITKALENAKVDEKIEKDKYMEFEEEQEKNAIISYQELKEEYDRLYEENEKTQYLDDSEIPINIDELYQLNNKEEIELEKHVEEVKQQEQSTFKNSPYISPVYGIQKPTDINNRQQTDSEIREANEFLNKLKELKDNLD